MEQVIRQAITFEVVKDGEVIDLGIQYATSVHMALPLLGDEVVLPMDTATGKGFTGNVFVVVKRQFLYTGVVGAAGAVNLILSRDK